MIPKQEHYTCVVTKALKFIEDINNRSNQYDLQKFDIEDQFKIPILGALRKRTCKRVFNKICHLAFMAIETSISEGPKKKDKSGELSYLIKETCVATKEQYEVVTYFSDKGCRC